MIYLCIYVYVHLYICICIPMYIYYAVINFYIYIGNIKKEAQNYLEIFTGKMNTNAELHCFL